MSKFKLVSFDADDTLWDFSAMMQRGNEAVVSAVPRLLGEDFSFMDLDYVVAIQQEQWMKSDPQKVNFVEMRRNAFREMVQKENLPNYNDLGDELLHIYLEARQQDYIFYDDAIPTLKKLRKRGFSLAYITNGTTLPESVGLADYFDVTILPETLNMRKPRPDIFHFAAAMVGCGTHQMMHIGDNLYSDVMGAQKAGARGVWFNPHREPNETHVRPNAEIRKLSTVLNMV